MGMLGMDASLCLSLLVCGEQIPVSMTSLEFRRGFWDSKPTLGTEGPWADGRVTSPGSSCLWGFDPGWVGSVWTLLRA